MPPSSEETPAADTDSLTEAGTPISHPPSSTSVEHHSYTTRAHLGSAPPGTAASRGAASCCCLFSWLYRPPSFPSFLDSLEVSSSAGTPKLLTHSTAAALHTQTFSGRSVATWVTSLPTTTSSLAPFMLAVANRDIQSHRVLPTASWL